MRAIQSTTLVPSGQTGSHWCLGTVRASSSSPKRLEHGEFRWLKAHEAILHLTATHLSAFLEGLDGRYMHTERERQINMAMITASAVAPVASNETAALV